MDKKINVEIDTTKFVNISDEKFVFHIGGQPRELEAHEEKIMPIYVAQLGAKHLVDLILQRKHDIKDTLRDTPLRRSILSEILPELPEQNQDFKRLSPEEEKQEIKKELARQAAQIAELSAKPKGDDEKDAKIAELEAKVNALVAASTKKEPKAKKVAE